MQLCGILMSEEDMHTACRGILHHTFSAMQCYDLKHGGACTRWHRKGGILNPASMKQALVEGAERIPGINLYEQGAGKMNLLNSTVGAPPARSPRQAWPVHALPGMARQPCLLATCCS